MCLQDIAVEAAFPQSGVTRVMDIRVEWNEDTMSALEAGRLYRGEDGGLLLTAGSRGEQRALEDIWGHPPVDRDVMYTNGGRLGVYVAGGQEPRGQSCLEFCQDSGLPGCLQQAGGRLNKKDGLTRYDNSHVKDKTS